jgi:hypothetical protein
MPLSAECPIRPQAATAVGFEPEELVARRSAMPLVDRAIKWKTIRGLEWRRGSARDRGLNAPALQHRQPRDVRANAAAASLCQAATQVAAVKRAISLN